MKKLIIRILIFLGLACALVANEEEAPEPSAPTGHWRFPEEYFRNPTEEEGVDYYPRLKAEIARQLRDYIISLSGDELEERYLKEKTLELALKNRMLMLDLENDWEIYYKKYLKDDDKGAP